MSRQYNHIYSQIVEDDTDVIGHIAYGLYKEQKIKFIEKKKDGDSERHLSEEDWQHFNEVTCTKDNICRYRLQATEILQNFMDDVLSETIEQIESDTKKNQEVILTGIIKPRGWWYGFLQSVAGAFAFMLLAAGIAFWATLSENEYSFTFGGNGSAKMERVETIQVPTDTTICNINK